MLALEAWDEEANESTLKERVEAERASDDADWEVDPAESEPRADISPVPMLAPDMKAKVAALRADRAIAAAVRTGDFAKVRELSGQAPWMAAAAANDNRKPISATPFVWKDPATIPRREWIYAYHYARRYLSATFGAGGGGKTSNSYAEGLAMASGQPLLGEIPRARSRVWMINLEDPAEEIERRVMGAAIHYKLRPEDIEGYLFTDSGRDQQVVVARAEGREIKIVEPMVKAMIAAVKDREIDVVIVDPFVSTHGVPENDNNAIQAVAEQWVRVAHEANCSVELVHHVRKSNGTEATADDGRGAGALKDKARSVRVVNGMTKEEAEKAGIPADEARRYFRIDFGKVNMVSASSSSWRRFASVSLGNGRGISDPADQIGVVEAWNWPTAAEIAEDVPDDAFRAIMARIASGDARESEQANDWAGIYVAEVLGLDLSEKGDKSKVRALLRAWLQAGHLRHEMGLDQKRNARKFIRVAAATPERNPGGARPWQGVELIP